MKLLISEYYQEKGFKAVYVNINKEPRRVAILVKQDGTKTSMSYAKYLYTSYYKCDVAEGDQVDYLNNDKMDDRIENLQVISRKLNISKSHSVKEMVEVVCPICGKKFLFPKGNLASHPNPCCSRRCGGIKSHLL